jgi:hypothetical protein
MPWGKVDDTFYDHPKLDELGRDKLPAIGLHWLIVSWCNRFLTDGVVPEERVKRLGGTPRLAAALVTARMWHHGPDHCDSPKCAPRAESGYRVHDYLGFNKSREEVERERRFWAEKKARSRGESQGDSQGESSESPADVPRSRPVPVPIPVPSRSIAREEQRRSNDQEREKERNEAIARALSKLNDPEASPEVRSAARSQLNLLEAS